MSRLSDHERKRAYALFHQLWSAAVGEPRYVKADWVRLFELLQKSGVFDRPS